VVEVTEGMEGIKLMVMEDETQDKRKPPGQHCWHTNACCCKLDYCNSTRTHQQHISESHCMMRNL